MKKIIGLLVIGGLVLVVGYFYVRYQKDQAISSFAECAAAGYPIMDSYPGQCRTQSGRHFIEDIGNEFEYQDQIQVTNPRPNQKVSSPLIISGQARGPWYFEASFSAEMFDSTNTSLGVIVIQASGDWMTEKFVPFTATMPFVSPQTLTGKLIIRNSNPSGLPENDKQLEIPVKF